jgi:hypothetical protein
MSIPITLSGRQVTTRPLSETTFPVIFGNVIALTGIGTTYTTAPSGTFTNNAGQTAPIVSLSLLNSGSSILFISFDGVNDNFAFGVSTQNQMLDLLNNRRGQPETTVWVRSATAGGSCYISYIM